MGSAGPNISSPSIFAFITVMTNILVSFRKYSINELGKENPDNSD